MSTAENKIQTRPAVRQLGIIGRIQQLLSFPYTDSTDELVINEAQEMVRQHVRKGALHGVFGRGNFEFKHDRAGLLSIKRIKGD